MSRRRNYQREEFEHGVLPPPQRGHHTGGLVREVRDSNETESIRVLGWKAKYECLLDYLLDEGHLRGDTGKREARNQVARDRFEQGMWFRGVYLSAHPESVTMDYTGMSGRAEMSDETAWNKKAWNDAVRFVGKHFPVLEAACCRNEPVSWTRLCRALDFLVEKRP